jgi:hypothetical protein
VLFGSQNVARADGERLRRTVPSFEPGLLEPSDAYAYTPGAFWMRRTAA